MGWERFSLALPKLNVWDGRLGNIHFVGTDMTFPWRARVRWRIVLWPLLHKCCAQSIHRIHSNWYVYKYGSCTLLLYIILYKILVNVLPRGLLSTPKWAELSMVLYWASNTFGNIYLRSVLYKMYMDKNSLMWTLNAPGECQGVFGLSAQNVIRTSVGDWR